MILGVPSSPGSQGVGGDQGGPCEERWAVWKRGCDVCVCVFLGLREECGEVGVWRAGRVEPRTFLAVELGGGNS